LEEGIMNFVLHFTNVVCSADGETFNDIEDAIARGRRAGFEFTVWKNDDKLVASWTVFGGLRRMS
jgi:hypothetical protein